MKDLLDRASILMSFIEIEERKFNDADAKRQRAQEEMIVCKANAENHRIELRGVLKRVHGSLERYPV